MSCTSSETVSALALNHINMYAETSLFASAEENLEELPVSDLLARANSGLSKSLSSQSEVA